MQGAAAAAQGALLGRTRPKALLKLLLKLGGRTTLDELEAAPHGIDLGPLEPRLKKILGKKRLQLAPEPLVRDLGRLAEDMRRASAELVLISRRTRVAPEQRTLFDYLEDTW